MARTRKFNVIVLLYTDPKTDRDRLKGILRFALQHPEWDVMPLPSHPANRTMMDEGNWTADGLITNEYTLTHYTGGDLSIWSKTKNIVIFDANSPEKFIRGAKQVNIDNDSAICGRFAAEHFLRHGLRSLAYVHMLAPRLWSNQRAEGFRETAEAAGVPCAIYQPPKSKDLDWSAEEGRLVTWIKALPKPCGILGANDARAMQIVRLCNRIGLAVPGEVSVMGVDNNDLATSFLRPTLTSIELENEQAGYLAAETLHAMMRNRPIENDHLTYGNPRLIERDSTCDRNGTARIISRALKFMSDYFTSDIDVPDIARAAGVSRRTLERRFADAGHMSPAHELRDLRLKETRRLLKETTLPLTEVARNAGFQTTLAAQTAFRNAYATTMREFRHAVRN